MEEMFPKWDRNHDGILGPREIKTAFQSQNTTGRAAAAIAVLQRIESRHFGHHEELESFTLEQIMDMANKENPHHKGTKKTFESGLKKISAASPQLFAHGLPKMDEIRQNGAIDCWFVCVVGALAHQRPKELASLIQPNDDGGYTVSFHDHKPVKVGSPSAGELSSWNTNGGDGLWLPVLLKAYGKVQLAKNSDKNKVDPIEGVVTHGGSVGPVIKILTGHESESKKPKAWGNNLRGRISDAFAKNHLVFVGVPGHVMAGYSYDSQTDQMQIWNPWGTSGNYKTLGAKMTNGLFSVPMSEIYAKCTHLVFEDVNPNHKHHK